MSEPIEVAPRESSVLRISLRTAGIMLLFAMVFTALMAGTYRATAPYVAASALAEKLRLIGEVLPQSFYDNDLLADALILPPQEMLGLDDETRIWRARKQDVPVALVLEAAAAEGYAGRIGLIMAVDNEGKLIALRVTSHKETPGLGDYINPKKDRNKARPWITQFNNLGFDAVAPKRWRVKKDGGHFDQMSGATISARAVTNASGRALAWAAARRDKLFTLPPNTRYTEERTPQ